MHYNLYVHGTPVPKGRPRFSGRGGFARSYTPKKTREYEALVAESFKSMNPKAVPIQGYVNAIIRVYFPVPKSATKKVKQDMLLGKTMPTTRKDLDNVVKSCLDALNGLAYQDDSQVVEIHAYKAYAEHGYLVAEIHEHGA